MRPTALRTLSAIVLGSAAVLSLGCSDNELQGGGQNLQMNYTPSPSGTGRFTSASFNINKIQALPVDPAAAALYGPERLSFRFTPFSADLVLTTPVPYANITLSSGTYRVTVAEFTPPALVDEHLAPPPYASCLDGVAVINRQSVTPELPASFTLVDPPNLTFTVQPGQTSLALKVNVPALIAGYESAFTCQMVPCPGCPVDPKPTLTAFDQAAFQSALLATISIE